MSKRKTKSEIETADTSTSENTSESAKANTVRGKRALYQQTAVNFQLAANEMVQSGIRDMQAGVHEIQVGIFEKQVLTKEQIGKFKEGAVAFQSGVAEMVSGIAEMRTSFAKQIIENEEYTKQFYG